MKTLEGTNPSARGTRVYKGLAESRSELGRSIITMVQPRRVAPVKGSDPKLRNESCRQVSPSQVRNATTAREPTRQPSEIVVAAQLVRFSVLSTCFNIALFFSA